MSVTNPVSASTKLSLGRMARNRRFLMQFYTCGEENRNTEEADVETLLKKRVRLGSWENRYWAG